MDRSLYPDGVEVHQVDLTRDSSAKASAITRRHIDTSTMGVVSGLIVSLGSDTTKVKISPGIGYTSSGEIVNVTTVLDNIPLADSGAGAFNYVCLVYTEVQSLPKPHEDLGISLNTAAVGTYRVAILTQSQYNTLLPTDVNLNNNALDRLVLLAIVSASGVGVALNPVGIQSASVYSIITTINEPTNITGVLIETIDGGIPLGTGTLTFNPNGITLKWQAPNDAAGAAIPLLIDGSYNIPSGTAGESITVSVLLGKLPSGVNPVVDSLTVSSLYSQSIPRFTPRDEQHRHFVGSGTPTPKNPHGLAPEDMGLGTSDTSGAIAIHRRQQHTAMMGVHNSMGAGLVVVNPSALPNTLVVNQLAAGDYAFVGGSAITAFTGSPLSLPNITQHANPGLYEVFVDGSAVLQLSRRVDMTAATQFPIFCQIVDIADDWDTNYGPITVAYNPASSGSISINGRSTSLSSLGGNPGLIRVYANTNQNLWVDIWVYPVSRPGVVVNEVWQILAPVDQTRVNSLVLATVHWSGNTSGHFGYKLGALSAGVACDKRFLGFSSGTRGGAPGASLGVDASGRQGRLLLSKDGVQDLALTWDKLDLLIGDAAGIKSADTLHSHPSISAAISAETSRAITAEAALQASITGLSGSFSRTEGGVVQVGLGANDAAVNIGKADGGTGQPTPTTIQGTFFANKDASFFQNIDTTGARALKIGSSAATAVQIGKSGATTEAMGNFQVDGRPTWSGSSPIGPGSLVGAARVVGSITTPIIGWGFNVTGVVRQSTGVYVITFDATNWPGSQKVIIVTTPVTGSYYNGWIGNYGNTAFDYQLTAEVTDWANRKVTVSNFAMWVASTWINPTTRDIEFWIAAFRIA